MSDVMTSQRAQEISERTQLALQKGQSAAPVQTAQAVFPDDNVELSAEAKSIVAGEASKTGSDKSSLEKSILMGSSSALDQMNAQLDRLMSLYGVSSEQTTVAGQKVTEALRNEVRRLAGTVMPPALDVQVKQELNLIAKKIEIKLEMTGEDEAQRNVSVDVGKVDLEYSFKEEAGNLLVPPDTMGTDATGSVLDVGQADSGLYFLDDSQSGDGAATDAQGQSLQTGTSAFDRFSARAPITTDGIGGSTGTAATNQTPSVQIEGAGSTAENSALLVVSHAPERSQQISTGISMFVADLAVPIQTRGSEAVPSRPQRGYPNQTE